MARREHDARETAVANLGRIDAATKVVIPQVSMAVA
jgi:hypothetical protein